MEQIRRVRRWRPAEGSNTVARIALLTETASVRADAVATKAQLAPTATATVRHIAFTQPMDPSWTPPTG